MARTGRPFDVSPWEQMPISELARCVLSSFPRSQWIKPDRRFVRSDDVFRRVKSSVHYVATAKKRASRTPQPSSLLGSGSRKGDKASRIDLASQSHEVVVPSDFETGQRLCHALTDSEQPSKPVACEVAVAQRCETTDIGSGHSAQKHAIG